MKMEDKLQIDLKKLISKQQLLTLKGGYGNDACCTCTNGYAMPAGSSAQCEEFCHELPGQHGVWRC